MGSREVVFRPPMSVEDFFAKLSEKKITGRVTIRFTGLQSGDKPALMSAMGLFNAGLRQQALDAAAKISSGAKIEIEFEGTTVSSSLATIVPKESTSKETSEQKTKREYVENIMKKALPTLIAKDLVTIEIAKDGTYSVR